MRLTHLVATFGGIGHLRPAPGTWGSAAALPVAWLLHLAGGPLALAVGAVVAFVAGVWATRIETVDGPHDPSEIVIDEVAGQWVALLPVSFGAATADVSILALWPGWIVAFLGFRALDIAKPGPIGWADRRNDVWGVMLDDVLAGIGAAVAVIVLGALYHILLM